MSDSSRGVSTILRVGQLAFAAIVAGIFGVFLSIYEVIKLEDGRRAPALIYVETIAVLSILLSLVWLLISDPFSSGVKRRDLALTIFDVLLALAWFAAFGILAHSDHIVNQACNYSNQYYGCHLYNAGEAFCFLSAIFWLASGVLGLSLCKESAPAPREAV